MAYPRELTDAEFDAFKEFFPNLDRSTTWLTGDQTDVYNCIAFSLGFTDRCIDPESPLVDFQQQYAAYKFPTVKTLSPFAVVDGWGQQNGSKMTHGSRLPTDPGFRAQGLWESKLGASYRMVHGRNALAKDSTVDTYGTIMTSFGPRVHMSEGEAPELPAMEPELTDEEREQLTRHALALVQDADLVGEFELRSARYAEAFRASMLSDTAAGMALPEFADLVALGPDIVPLVIAALDEPGGYRLLRLLEVLEPTLTAVRHDPMTGRQSLARLTARAWLAAR